MYRIENHIEILLLNHDCVIIPGFGGFVTHHVPAHYDSSDGVMLPPCVTIGFNPQLKLNDSLLTQSYADSYEVSYPEASQMIDEDIATVKKHIEQNGRWHIHSVGEFTLNSNGHYVFEPCDTGIVRPEYYALTGIETGINTVIAPTCSEEILTVTNDRMDTDKNYIRISHSTLKKFVAACMILAVIIISAFNHNTISSKIQECGINLNAFEQLIASEKHEMKTAQKVEKEVVAVAVASAEEETATANIETKAEEAVAETDVQEEKAPVQDNIKPYVVVLASQVTLPNAEEFVGKMKARGYDDIRIIGDKLKSRKIVYGNYATFEEATQVKAEFNKDPEFASAWVTEIK